MDKKNPNNLRETGTLAPLPALPPGTYTIVGTNWLRSDRGPDFLEIVVVSTENFLFSLRMGMRVMDPEITRNRFWSHNPISVPVIVVGKELHIPEMATKVAMEEVQVYDVHRSSETDL